MQLKKVTHDYLRDIRFGLSVAAIFNYGFFMIKKILKTNYLSFPLVFTNICLLGAFLIALVDSVVNGLYSNILNSYDLPAVCFFALNPNWIFILPLILYAFLHSIDYAIDRNFLTNGAFLGVLNVLQQQRAIVLTVSAVAQLVNFVLILLFIVVIRIDKGIILFTLALLLLRNQVKREKVVFSCVSSFFNYCSQHIVTQKYFGASSGSFNSVLDILKNFVLSQRKIVIYDMTNKKSKKLKEAVCDIGKDLKYVNGEKGFFTAENDEAATSTESSKPAEKSGNSDEKEEGNEAAKNEEHDSVTDDINDLSKFPTPELYNEEEDLDKTIHL